MRLRPEPGPSAFDRWGGQPFFDALVARFYEGVATDPVLRPLYPEDLTQARDHLALFFAQYWGGPPTYSETRGHPRLRLRHVPFRITTLEADAWLRHMLGALDAAGLEPDDRAEFADYLTMAARSLVNARG